MRQEDSKLSGTQISLRELVAPRRRCGVPIAFRHKTNRMTVMVKRVSCGSWHCEKCGPELRQKWLGHLTTVLSSLPQVYISHTLKSSWRTLSKRILRAGGQSVAIEQAGGYLVVFSNATVGESVSSEIALSELRKAVAGAITAASKRPIHTSRGWGFPKSGIPVVSQWERIGKLSVSVEEAHAIVKSAGLQPSSFFGDFTSGFVVKLPVQVGQDKDDVIKQFTDLMCKTGVWSSA